MSSCVDWGSFVESLAPFGAALLAFVLGLWSYRRQKEHELIRLRYLEGGVDRFAANIEYALGAIRHNYSRTLQILKLYRDVDLKAASELASRSSFRQIDPAKMDLEAGYRVEMLTHNASYGRAQAHLFALADAAENFFINDIGALVRGAAAGNISVRDKSEVIDRAAEEARSYQDRARRFYTLFYRLQDLGRLLERSHISFHGLDDFAEDSEVRRIGAKIDAIFQPEDEGADEAPDP